MSPSDIYAGGGGTTSPFFFQYDPLALHTYLRLQARVPDESLPLTFRHPFLQRLNLYLELHNLVVNNRIIRRRTAHLSANPPYNTVKLSSNEMPLSATHAVTPSVCQNWNQTLRLLWIPIGKKPAPSSSVAHLNNNTHTHTHTHTHTQTECLNQEQVSDK
jgi:hypothetical protein